ncbi:AT-hook motif nuclear-localized protein 29-like, partial [Quercus lobata]|uniref:AT-hook motif nuclear-localized protein 29-like n=1 Tax=Quercus lobata TaxID=97700 RepID=UPI001248DF5F
QPLSVVRSHNPGQVGSARYVHHLLRPELHLQNQTQTQTQRPLFIDNPQPSDSLDSPDEGDHKHDSDAQATSSGAATTNSNRRPRGRPPGSKNKPKPPIIVTRDSLNALRSHMLEESNAADIVESVSNYARRRGRGVCVLSGTGTVVNVTWKQPAGSSVVTLHGRFEILSLSDLKKTKPLSFGSTKKKKNKTNP